MYFCHLLTISNRSCIYLLILRPNYFIFIGYLTTWGREGVQANPPNPLWISHWTEHCLTWFRSQYVEIIFRKVPVRVQTGIQTHNPIIALHRRQIINHTDTSNCDTTSEQFGPMKAQSNMFNNALILSGLQREKPCLRLFANNTGADQPAHLHRLISPFVIRFLESIICRLGTGELTIFQLVPLAEETGLKLSLSETPKTGFLATRPKWSNAD